MNILMVTSEAVPFSKSGGLADVVGALAPALNSKGHNTKIVVPAYNTGNSDAGKKVCEFSVHTLARDERVEIRSKTVNETEYCFVCHPLFTDRLGIYGDTSFTPYNDNLLRFSLFCKAALLYCIETGFKPDVIHCHDWTAGLLPYFMKAMNSLFFMDTKTVFTIHNLAYQGTFSKMDFLLTDTKADEDIVFNDRINMLYCGLMFSDFITTVSPTYAKEIQSAEQGCGLESIISERKKHLRGIVNGIDTNEWNPERDKLLENGFSASDLSGKKKLKTALQRRFGLPEESDTPLFAMISRLAVQKGFDALIPCLEKILKENKVQFVIIGTGDRELENTLLGMAERNPNLSVNIMFSNSAAHLAEAGSDFFLMPSRYEPCGLNQLYSLRYGTIPIARRTGGLADTVIDIDEFPQNGNGLLFDNLCPQEIEKSVLRAVKLYGNENFKEIIRRAMSRDSSWDASADEYIEVFCELKKDRRDIQ
ncbi:MAG: glycogen synthase GlgA [Sphaerochaetaceae bacterium]|nr:glycogen synthase GlgA [Sphaerochaetaceae bacterium]